MRRLRLLLGIPSRAPVLLRRAGLTILTPPRPLARVALAGVMLALAASEANAAMEIWLASTGACNSCGIFREAAQARGYGNTLRYVRDGADLTIPILSVAKSDLDGRILRQLSADMRRGEAWDVGLTVLVVDGARVLAAGNIAESADNREIRHAERVMFPPSDPEEDDPALDEGDLYRPFFVAHWNLEYFVDVALGLRAPRASVPVIDLGAPRPYELGTANVILWGSAGTPRDNALYIPTRVREIRSALDGLGLGGIRYVTLYGHGPDVAGNDTSYIVGGRTHFRRADLDADLGADAASLSRVLTGVRESAPNRTLLIQVGHSGRVGSPLWGAGLTMVPDDLAPLRDEPGVDLVMISGACNGGMYASAVQCGFFAAHPEVVASGCQRSPEALVTSDDYLRHFFRAATGTERDVTVYGSRRRPPTLAAAHWYATARLEDHQISYTTTDALIDAYFEANPEGLPAVQTVGDLLASADVLDADETRALESLTAGLPRDLAIPLTGFIERNHEAQAKLVDATELSSAERNAITAMPYRLALPVLARRVVYESSAPDDAVYAAATSCERRSIPELLGGGR